MDLLNKNLTLKRIEELLLEQLIQVNIIGDLSLSQKDFEYLAEKIKSFIQVGANNELFKNYKGSVATFLVFVAVYRFEGNSYWPHVEEYTGYLETHQRSSFYNRFLYILEQLNLPKFEREQGEGYKYVTPIVCHAGIPQSCLNDYFEVVSDTLNNTTFFEGHILDEFKYYMRYRVQKPVIRYFNYLETRGEQFLQESRELLLYCDSEDTTIQEAATRFSYLPKRITEKCFEWINTDQAKEKVKNRKNIVLTAPQIMLDAHGMGIYAFLPQQSIKECIDDAISWEIKCGEREYTAKARLFVRGEAYASEEKTLPLSPCDNYKISLFLEDKNIGAWEYKGLADGYICFDSKGSLIKKSNLPPENIVIIFDKNKDLSYNSNIFIEELPYLPKWVNYKTYRVNLKDVNQLVCNFASLEIKKDNKPKLIGGKTLFDLSEGMGASCYTQLPEIIINDRESENWYLTTMLKHDKKEIYSNKEIIPNGLQKIPLKNYIGKSEFGEYDIIIWNPKGNSNRFFIKYVPAIEYLYDEKASWPSGSKGYINNEFYCRYSQRVSLEFENANYVGNVLKNGRDYTKYIFNNIGRYFHGKMSFSSNNHTYTLPIKKSIRPIMWGFMGMGSDTAVTWDSSPKTLSLKDIQNNTDAYLIISVDDSGLDFIRLDISVFANNKQRLIRKSISADNYNRYRIPLNSFLLDMQAVEDSNFNFILEVYDPNDEEVCECLIARIQEDVIYSDLNVYIDDFISFNWKEKGAKIDRELVLYNCFMPWEESRVFSLENGKCQFQISANELVDSMYAIKIRNTDNFAFFDVELEIPKITNMGQFCAGKSSNNLLGVKTILANILENAFANNEYKNNHKKEINYQPEYNSDEIKALCISYIFLVRNRQKTESMKLALKMIKKLISLFAQDKYIVLKVILNMNLRKSDVLRLLAEFHMLSIRIKGEKTFSPVERDILWNYLPELAFIIDIQVKANSGRICNWIGDNVISSMVDIVDECSLRDCLDKLLIGSCRCSKISFRINEDILGSIKHKRGFFDFLSQDYFSAKRLEKFDDIQLFKFYEQQKENTELKIFGKSYFMTVQEWISSIEKAEREKIEDILRKVVKKSVDVRYIADNNPLAYKILNLRLESEEDMEFYQGMIVFMDCLCRRGLLEPSKVLEQAITFISQKCNPLYKRDLVIFELYLTFGGI